MSSQVSIPCPRKGRPTVPAIFLLMNHKLTDAQEQDARASLRVNRILELPMEHKQIWNQIPAEPDAIKPVLEPICHWLDQQARSGDFLLVQGDFGACHLMVKYAVEKQLVPVYSCTRRDAAEEHTPEGAVIMRHRFRHVRFRRYGA